MKRALHFAFCLILAWPLLAPSQQTACTKQEYLDEVRTLIRGHEDEPAENVFKNIEILKGKKASRLPDMMNALTGLLGVECNYCHTPGHWEDDDKKPKQIARKHFQLIKSVNHDYFQDENKVSCWTCHRGQPKAPLLPDAPK